jgi:transcriptional regulator with XRE-family HTH domain
MIKENILTHDELRMKFAHYIRDKRLENGWSQYKMAKVSGIGRSTLANIEMNRDPHTTTPVCTNFYNAYLLIQLFGSFKEFERFSIKGNGLENFSYEGASI